MATISGEFLKSITSHNVTFRNSFIAMAGVILGQIANFATVFIVGKEFGPASLGHYNFLLAIGLFLGAVAGMKYELACVAERSEAALDAFVHAVLLAGGILLFAALIIIPIYGKEGVAILAMAGSIFLQQAIGFVLNSKKEYKKMAVVRALPSVLFVVVLRTSLALKCGERIGQDIFVFYSAAHLLIMLLAVFVLPIREIAQVRIGFRFFIENRDFARFSLPAAIMNSCVLYAIPISMPLLFGKEVAGFFSLAYRIGMFPVALFTQSIGAVLRRELLDYTNDHSSRNGKSLLNRMMEYLSVISVISIITTIVCGVALKILLKYQFEYQWIEASSFYRLLAPSFIAAAIFGPISQVFIVLRSQRSDFTLQAASASAVFGIFLCAWIFNLPVQSTTVLLSTSTTVFALVGIGVVISLTKIRGQ